MNILINEEARKAIVRYFNDAKEHITRISVREYSGSKIYKIEIGKNIYTDEISNCQIVENGYSSKLIPSISVFKDQVKIEESIEVSLSIDVLINKPPLNRYEDYIRIYLDELSSLR